MNPLEERAAKQAHLEALDAFLVSPAYAGWEVARLAMLRICEVNIIENLLRTREEEIQNFKDKGQRELLLDLANQFQDARVTLNSRLEELDELLNPNAKKTENNEE